MQLHFPTGKGDRLKNIMVEKVADGFSPVIRYNSADIRALNSVFQPEPPGLQELDICGLPRALLESQQDQLVCLLHEFPHHRYHNADSQPIVKRTALIIRHRVGHSAGHQPGGVLRSVLVNILGQLLKVTLGITVGPLLDCDKNEVLEKLDWLHSHLYCQQLCHSLS